MNGNVIPFEVLSGKAIQMKRSPEFHEKARELSSYIESLCLPTERNDELIALMVEQVNIAEKDAFFQGAQEIIDYLKYEEEHK